MNELLFSVVIPAFNQGRWLAECLQSVFSQGWEDVEVIVVDDGSTDETPAILSGFAERVRVIRQKNAGVAVARNRGITESHGKWIAFLDADDCWRPGHLDRLACAIEAHPEAGLIFTEVMIIDEEGRPLKPRPSSPFSPTDAFRSILLENPVVTSAAAVRKAALTKVGMFDPGLKGPEDWDLWLRLARHYPVVRLPDLSINYRRHGAGLIHTRGLAFREDTMKVLRRVERENPDLPPSLLRQARANRYLESAVRLLDALEISTARQEILSALRQAPFNARAWALLILSLAGKTLLQAGLRFWRRRENRP